MSSQAKSREPAPPARPNQTTFLDEVITTFSSPMAWLLVVALILTWSGVAIVLFDLLDYKTLAGTCTHFMALFIQYLISIFHFHIMFHDNFVYPSLNSHVSIHFQQPFSHFWNRLQKCFNENIITSCLLLAPIYQSAIIWIKTQSMVYKKTPFQQATLISSLILSHIHILIGLIVQLNVNFCDHAFIE